MTAILTMSVLTEAIITYVRTAIIEKKIKWPMIVSVVLSIIICVAYRLDIPSIVGINSNIPYIGSVLTGILVSRGSNYISDLFYLISKPKGVEIMGADGSEGAEI